jgi:Zn-dependent protease with chaperone function
MRAGVLLLFAVSIAGALPDMSEAPGPGTSSPASGNCGQRSRLSVSQLQGLLRATFEDAATLAGLPSAPPLVFDKVRNAQNAYVERTSKAEVVHVNPSICDVTKTEAEVAFVLAHECAHIKERHYPRIDEEQVRLTAVCGDPTCVQDGLNKFMTDREDEADALALEYLSKPESRWRVDAKAASIAYQKHLKDLYWAINAQHQLDATHHAPSERADALRKKADEISARGGAMAAGLQK